MSEIKSRADLLEAAAKMMRMCDEAGVTYSAKLYGEIRSSWFLGAWFFVGNPSDYEFPLAIVEGKPVFKGDKIYDKFGNAWIADTALSGDCSMLSWNPPKPKTVMVELLREDADRFFNSFDEYPDGLHGRIARACHKALEELK